MAKGEVRKGGAKRAKGRKAVSSRSRKAASSKARKAPGPKPADLERARALRERSLRIDATVVQRRNEPRSRYLKRRSKAKSDAPRGAPPPPKGSPWRNNATYQRHRGYYYRGSDGKWRTPDGRVAKGQSLKELRVFDPKKRRFVTEKRYHLPKANRHNDRNRSKLVREDAYLSLLGRGVLISRSKFDRLVGKRPKSRDDVLARIAKAYQKDRLLPKPRSRKEVRRDVERDLDANLSKAGDRFFIEIAGEAVPIRRRGEESYVNEETGETMSRSDLLDIWERDFYGGTTGAEGGFDFEEWRDDYDRDSGDTP